MAESLVIGIVPDPQNHADWSQIEAFLEPAAKRGGVPLLEENETVWVAYDGPALQAVMTARLTESGAGEVVLVGGRDCRRWVAPMYQLIGQWMADEGMTVQRAYGRRGWIRILKDWTVIGDRDGVIAYERHLNVQEK